MCLQSQRWDGPPSLFDEHFLGWQWNHRRGYYGRRRQGQEQRHCWTHPMVNRLPHCRVDLVDRSRLRYLEGVQDDPRLSTAR